MWQNPINQLSIFSLPSPDYSAIMRLFSPPAAKFARMSMHMLAMVMRLPCVLISFVKQCRKTAGVKKQIWASRPGG